MSESFDQAFTDYLSIKIHECLDRAESLRADDRGDEANFESIRKNVYDIFLTVYKTAVCTCPDEASIHLFFTGKLEQIPANWLASLERARLHSDAQKQHIENLKLEALSDVKAAYERIGRDQSD